MEFKANKVDNGWVLQITKFDYINNRPDKPEVTVHETLESVLKHIEKSK